VTVMVLAVIPGETQQCDRDWVFILVKAKAIKKMCVVDSHLFE